VKLPGLTAERAIGPAMGTYLNASAAGSVVAAARQAHAALSPMQGVGTLVNLVSQDPAWWMGKATTPFCQELTTCWGNPDTRYSNAYTCCANNQNCAYGDGGRPACGPAVVSQATVTQVS